MQLQASYTLPIKLRQWGFSTSLRRLVYAGLTRVGCCFAAIDGEKGTEARVILYDDLFLLTVAKTPVVKRSKYKAPGESFGLRVKTRPSNCHVGIANNCATGDAFMAKIKP